MEEPSHSKDELNRLAESLLPILEKKVKPRNVYGRNDFSAEEVLEVKIMLRVVKWLLALSVVCVLAVAGLVYSAASDHINYGNTKEQVSKMSDSISSMQTSNAAMQSSQIDLVKKVDGFGHLIENLDRRVAAHNKQNDETP